MPPKAGASTAVKRLTRELENLKQEELTGLTIIPDESNLFSWKALMSGSGAYAGIFELNIIISNQYPFSPPRVVFVTKIYHCNVSAAGDICIDILKSSWSPALSIVKVLLSISSLLLDPNPYDPLVPPIAEQYLKNRALHDKTALEWTLLYAKPLPSTGSTTKRARSDSVEIQEGSSKKKGPVEVIVID